MSNAIKTNKASDFRKAPNAKSAKNGSFKKGEEFIYISISKDGNKNWYKISQDKYISSSDAGKPYTKNIDNGVSGLSDSSTTNYVSAAKGEKLKNANQLDKEIQSLVNTQINSLESGIDGTMRLFGLPHQLSEKNDYRLSKSTGLGTMFTETFIVDAPLLYIKPGKSKFLPGMSTSEKKNIVNGLMRSASGNRKTSELASVFANMGDKDWRYFEFTPAYSEYITDVNWLCRIVAVFLGINKLEVPWEKAKGNSVTYGAYDWSNYQFSALFQSDIEMNSDIGGGKPDWVSLVKDTIKQKLSNILDDTDYIQFYVDASSSFNENASNSTSTSIVSSFMEQVSQIGQELSFVSGVSGLNIDDLVNSSTSTIDSAVTSIAKGDGAIATFLKRLTGTSKQVLAGSNFLTPETWSGSDYGKGYSFSITLATPYGTSEARYLNIMVPLMHILAIVLPMQTSANTYTSPRLIKAYSPGWFSSDLGIVDSISIDKGGSGDAWGADGLPNEIKITMTIKDLYANLALPTSFNLKTFFSNTGLVNYLMINCGINITKQSLDDKVAIICNLFLDNISSTVKETVGGIYERFKDSMRKTFNLFK